MKIYRGYIPFDYKDNLREYGGSAPSNLDFENPNSPDEYREVWSLQHNGQTDPRYDTIWRRNKVFKDTVEIKDYTTRYSSTNFKVVSTTNNAVYYITLKEFFSWFADNYIDYHHMVTGEFSFAKKGSNFKLVKVS